MFEFDSGEDEVLFTIGKDVCYTKVDYNELEWIVEAFYPDYFHEYGHPDWETDNIVSENEWNNDSYENIDITTEYSDFEVEAFLNDPDRWKEEFQSFSGWGASKRPSYRAFLEDLWNLGVIKHDEFLVAISW